MADKESKKVKTEESAYDTIVGETSADIKEQDDATTDVNVMRMQSSRNVLKMPKRSTRDFSQSVRTSDREMRRRQANILI